MDANLEPVVQHNTVPEKRPVTAVSAECTGMNMDGGESVLYFDDIYQGTEAVLETPSNCIIRVD